MVSSLPRNLAHQQVEIVIAEYGLGRVAKRLDQTQRFQRFRATVDQVADQPQAIDDRIEGAALE